MRPRAFAGVVCLGLAVSVGPAVAGPTKGPDRPPPDEPRPGAFSADLPDELQFSDFGHHSEEATALAERLAQRDPDGRLAAACALWRGHSRRYAADVLKYLAGPPPGGEPFRAFQREVEAALRPEAVLKELKDGDYPWGAWLAFLRPHKDLVPALLAALKD